MAVELVLRADPVAVLEDRVAHPLLEQIAEGLDEPVRWDGCLDALFVGPGRAHVVTVGEQPIPEVLLVLQLGVPDGVDDPELLAGPRGGDVVPLHRAGGRAGDWHPS